MRLKLPHASDRFVAYARRFIEQCFYRVRRRLIKRKLLTRGTQGIAESRRADLLLFNLDRHPLHGGGSAVVDRDGMFTVNRSDLTR